MLSGIGYASDMPHFSPHSPSPYHPTSSCPLILSCPLPPPLLRLPLTTHIHPSTHPSPTHTHPPTEKLFRNLSQQHGYRADVMLIHTLVNLAATLKKVAIQHPLERDIFLLYDRVEEALRQCMNSNSMDIPLNVMKVLRDPDKVETDAVIFRQALAFLDGPLKLCIKYDLTGLLGTAQVSNHVRTVFWASLKPTRRNIIREFGDIFQVRSGCTTYRYRPVFMFLFKCLSKIVYLLLVASVSAEEDCAAVVSDSVQGGHFQCARYEPLKVKECCIVVMLLTSVMFEVGEMIDRGGMLAHFAQVRWVDVILTLTLC